MMQFTHSKQYPKGNDVYVVDAPPVLLYSFIEQTLQPGPAVSLKCSATGNPTPQISWALDGFPLPSNGRSVHQTLYTTTAAEPHSNLTLLLL